MVGDINCRLIICRQVLPTHYLFTYGLAFESALSPPLLAIQMRWGYASAHLGGWTCMARHFLLRRCKGALKCD